MKTEYLTINPFQTKKTGEILAQEILKTKPFKKAFLLGLKGELGSGKTCFLQGFARGLGIRQKITSSTFVIMRRYQNFYHIDCYRIKKPKELLALGFEKIAACPANIIAVEWADRVERIIPEGALWLEFEFLDKNKRKIVVESKDGK